MRNRSCSAQWTLASTAALQPIKHSNDSLLSPWRLEIYCTGTCTSPSHDKLCYLYIALIPDFAGDSFPRVIQAFSGEPVWRWQSDRVFSLYPSSSMCYSSVFLPYTTFFRFPLEIFPWHVPKFELPVSKSQPGSGHAELHTSGLYVSAAEESWFEERLWKMIWPEKIDIEVKWCQRGVSCCWMGWRGKKEICSIRRYWSIGKQMQTSGKGRKPRHFSPLPVWAATCHWYGLHQEMLTWKIRGILQFLNNFSDFFFWL